MPAVVDPALAVVIPAYQAAATLGSVLDAVRATLPDAAVYVVDDGSTDGTADVARQRGATALAHPRNWGKGAALQTGIARALADGAGLVITLDADGQHPPAALPRLVAPVRAGEADLALGARARTSPMPLLRRCSNWLSAVLVSRLAGTPVMDAQTGLRAFNRPLGEAVRPVETRYDYEAAFLLGAVAAGYRVRAVPVPTVYAGAASHFHRWYDTWRVARVFARYGWRILKGGGGV